MNRYTKANNTLKQTSRTFYIPINNLPGELNKTVTSAYLCMRAIDEIEDDPTIPKEIKIELLQEIKDILLGDNIESKLKLLFEPHKEILKDVTLELFEWIDISPSTIKQNILQSTSEMAGGMAKWVSKDWEINTVEELDDYTYYVAGLVGLLLSDIWFWHDDFHTNRNNALAFGRGLQVVNMIRNREEDIDRGVDFFPNGWSKNDMITYARENLAKAELYVDELKKGPILVFCNIPLQLAHGTLDAIELGKEKLTRTDVLQIVSKVLKSSVK